MSQPNSDTPVRSYDRSWEEIEDMLEKATDRRDQWKKWFEQCKKDGDRDGMKEAARNHKALDGVIKTLQWTLGEEGAYRAKTGVSLDDLLRQNGLKKREES